MRFGLIVDFRTSPLETRGSAELYTDTVDHLVQAEQLGFGHALIGEHHFTDDHFMPSPLIAATAIAARTTTMRVATNVALLPLYHPVRLAEDVAVLDVLSNGRVDLGVGVGYNAVEFAGYGVAREHVGRTADRTLGIVRRLLSGETVDGVRITPPPVQRPHPPIWVGGASRAAARPPAVHGDAYTGPADPAFWRMYLEELAKTGKQPRLNLTGSPWLFVSEDPERTLALVGPGLLHWFAEAARMTQANNVQTTGIRGIENVDDLRGLVSILTPDDMVAKIRSIVGELPVDTFGLRLAAPGMPARDVADHLELFAGKVLPHFSGS
jgi:alkanesulfonate monooxygenase SsuD/methylene tetrahydromethanopterin reductase-like flavin-dependent oxidoreductase (luciferase family)